ncbi:hypothetical protein HYY72_04985 [Candidatus Woesearchaeota archaeon]|nr:hypothetical protein [Candidatus Woesearchaeota archaeon]
MARTEERAESGKRLPEKKFRAGAVAATIWRNESEKGSYATVQIDRSYKDGDSWKSTGSLRVNDLPKAVLVLSKAYDYLVSRGSQESSQERDEQIPMEEIM